MPTREVVDAEARAWLERTPAPPRASVITSMPDLSEMREEASGFAEVPQGLPRWRSWFVDAARPMLVESIAETPEPRGESGLFG